MMIDAVSLGGVPGRFILCKKVNGAIKPVYATLDNEQRNFQPDRTRAIPTVSKQDTVCSILINDTISINIHNHNELFG